MKRKLIAVFLCAALLAGAFTLGASASEYMRPGDVLARSDAEIRQALDARVGDEPMTIWLGGGMYTEPLSLTGLKNVTFQAVPGEEVIFSGSKTITGWTADQVNGVACWSVAYGGDYFTSLYHPDPAIVLERPRYPAQGYLYAEGEGTFLFPQGNPGWDQKGHTSLYAKAGDLRQFHGLTDITLRIPHYWEDEMSQLVSYDENTRELTWERPATMNVLAGERYYLENVFEELKKPGQWYLDRESAKLYYIPFAGESIAGAVLYAGVNVRMLTISNSENIAFRNITIRDTAWAYGPGGFFGVPGMEGPQFAGDAPASVWVQNSAGIVFDGCKFHRIGAAALKLSWNVHNSSVINCEFTQIGAGPVFHAGDSNAPGSYLTIKNNLISGFGKRWFNANGIINNHGRHVDISNNEITGGHCTGISNGAVWGYNPNPTDHVTIENNLVYNLGGNLVHDWGAVYCLGSQPNTVIRGNVVHDIGDGLPGGNYGTQGIYPDEGSRGLLIENNLVYDCGSMGFSQHYGQENIVRNNIFAFNQGGQVQVSRDHIYRSERWARTSIFFEKNIVVGSGQSMYMAVEAGKFIDDGNLYWDFTRGARVCSDDRNVACMKKLGYYNNGVFADPLFEDAAKRDFRLKANSPALAQIGFVPWDIGAAGRLASPVEIPAHEIKPTYTITVEGENGGTASANAKAAAPGDKVVLFTNAPGLRFTGWTVTSGDVTIADDGFVMPDGPVTIRAGFEPIGDVFPGVASVKLTRTIQHDVFKNAVAIAGKPLRFSSSEGKFQVTGRGEILYHQFAIGKTTLNAYDGDALVGSVAVDVTWNWWQWILVVIAFGWTYL